MDKLAGELLNDSDSDDQDYVPSGAESEEEDDVPPEDENLPDEDEEEKRKTAALWADFMADVEPVPKKARVDEAIAKDSVQNDKAEGQEATKGDAGVSARVGSTSEASSSTRGQGDDGSKAETGSGDGKDSGSSADKAASSGDANSKADSGTACAGGSGEGNKIKVTQILDFAGEKIEVEKELDKDSKEAKRLLAEQSKQADEKKVLVRPKVGGGLSTVVGGLLNKKSKMSILEKSKLDWNGFKRAEGIEEELANHNKGKDGYLERMAFLDRTDLRQFEIEKSIRERQRSSRGGNM